jgi:putative MATE family efflux protein
VLYFRLYFAGVPIFMLYNFCASILRATGDSRRPMVFLTVGGVVKVIFTFVFTAYFRMGVAGVGLATILSWGTSAFLGVHALVHNQGMVHLQPRQVRFYKAEMLTILRIGIPAGLQQALYSIANVIIVATVNSFGPEATTGISIANNYDGILYQISCATALAVTPYVSQNIGSGNPKRASQSVIRGVLITVALGASFGALSAIFSGQLSSVMSNDPTVIAYSRQKMVIISSTYFICGINEIMGGALRGLGKPMPPTVCTFLYMCVLRFVWVYLIFPLRPNLTFLYLVWPVGWSLSVITLLFFYIPTLKKHMAAPHGPGKLRERSQS